MSKVTPGYLRHEAAIAPHDVYVWLNPLLTDAADTIEQLQEWLQRCLDMVEKNAGPPDWDGIREVLKQK